MKKRTVGIFLFNEVEVLDFAGPFEVFSLADNDSGTGKAFTVCTVAQEKKVIVARNGLSVCPEYGFSDCPHCDIIIIPGGYGAEEIEINNVKVIEWIKERMKDVELMASVCTGAFLLARAGLLDGKKATTHWMDMDRLEKEYANVMVCRNKKFVDSSPILTSGGISAGINMSLYIVGKLVSAEVADATAKRMEFETSRA